MDLNRAMDKYFNEIDKRVNYAYEFANEIRKLGYDPEDKVDIPLAKNMAERIEGLISVVAPQIRNSGFIERIYGLEKKYGKLDWRVALTVSLEVAQEKFCKFENKREAMEVAIRIGLAYLTLGIVASPLEGFVRLELKRRRDGREYFCLYFSGPIRSAGTTITCGSILVADYIRREMGYSEYDPTEEEIKRIITEVEDFHERVTNLQYFPSKEELDFMARNLPLQIDGDPSEKYEVSNYKDLPRISTNTIRNGICLVFAESLTQKAPKFWAYINKWISDFNLGHWKFLAKFVKLQENLKARGEKERKETRIVPNYTYIKDLVAGRPILTHPLQSGGFRLRYGRSRISGLSSMGMHPATMHILNNFIATGTQLRYERPGKSSAMAPCDSIEGPIVKLKNGNVIFLDNEEDAKKVAKDVEEILFLGDFLVNYGEFYNRAHKLVPAGYCEEWYALELEKIVKEKNIDLNQFGDGFLDSLFKDPFNTKVSIEKSIELSKLLGMALYPRFTFHWKGISKEQLFDLLKWLIGVTIERENRIIKKIVLSLHLDDLLKDPKRVLELVGVPHSVVGKEHVIVEGEMATALAVNLGFLDNDLDEQSILDLKTKIKEEMGSLEVVNLISNVNLRDKSGIFIGARMGRPEKAKMRKLTGSPHVLFPVGKEGGKLRSFQSSLEKGKVKAEFPLFYCRNCDEETIYSKCLVCDNKTERRFYCNNCNKLLIVNNCDPTHTVVNYRLEDLDINRYFKNILKKMKLKKIPNLIKGVRGTSNKEHIPENLAKGVLRSENFLYVNKDGTIRYDLTEMPITAFKPKEIGVSILRLKELGYEEDIYGELIKNMDQLIEIMPQDVILPACDESLEEGADKIFIRVANFVDDLLVKFYGSKKFYNIKSRKDLVGHLIMGLAPHTSSAIVGRIIGFSKTQACFAHPMWHAAQRRDCEGDETAVMLLMDALLNFSRQYLPAHRGSTQDAPLVLTSHLVPSEVDDMVFDMDVVFKYPLEFYEAAQNYADPREIKIEQLSSRLETEKQYEPFGFTHNVSDLNMGVRCSAYKLIPSMRDKVKGQMEIADKIRAVNESDVARLIIERHFMRDIRGNLRKFSTQQFRCVDCNEKYRRPPLVGKCLICGGKLIFTVSEGSVIKYLEPSIELAEKYELPAYLKHTLELTKRMIESVFGKDKEKQEGLVKWFN